MPQVKNWLHCVWGTKNHLPFLKPSTKYEIITHIRTNAGMKGIYIDSINGHAEHLHCLLLLQSDHTLEFLMQMIKGESAHWINKNKLTKEKLEWADGYFGVSVSESHLSRVRDYIKNQEEHHKYKTWEEECREFPEYSGFCLVR